LDLGEIDRRRCVGAHNKNQIPSNSEAIIDDSNCLAHSASRAIAVNRIAHALPNHKPTARPASAAASSVESQQRATPRLSIAPHSLELVGLAQAIGAFHIDKTKNREQRTTSSLQSSCPLFFALCILFFSDAHGG
jgi:hypothetical protein